MLDKNRVNVVIIDDLIQETDPLLIELKVCGYNVKLFSSPNEALSYLEKKLYQKNIVVLDINLGDGMNGHDVLKKIREYSQQLPVIIWSALDGKKEDFTDFINNNAYSYVNQMTGTEEIIEHINAAACSLEIDIASSVEAWLHNNYECKDMLVLQDKHGKSFSVENLISEIRLQTPFGIELQKKFLDMTIGMFLYDKKDD